MPSKSKLLIDGDLVVYQSIIATEKSYEFEDDIFILRTDLTDAREAFQTKIDSLLRNAKVKDYTLCISGESNFRKDLYPAYKQQRKSTRKPLGFEKFKQWVIDTFEPAMKPNIEADDVVGILATKPGNEDYIIWSLDKDLKQIPGRHLVLDKVVFITPEEATRTHLMQTLTGDVIDNYPGCPGIGGAKAKTIVKKGYAGVEQAFIEAGLSAADALLQARLAKILHYNDWDTDTQTPKLWSPQ